MKTLAKHMNELGWDFDEDERARRLFEARDREIRAAALREAAEMVRADRGEIKCVLDLEALADLEMLFAERGK